MTRRGGGGRRALGVLLGAASLALVAPACGRSGGAPGAGLRSAGSAGASASSTSASSTLARRGASGYRYASQACFAGDKRGVSGHRAPSHRAPGHGASDHRSDADGYHQPPSKVPPTTVPSAAPKLEPGSSGPAVLALQERLSALHYWLGTPDGTFDDSTEQAVYAFQKAAGLVRDGVVGPKTEAALSQPVEPQPRSRSGYVIEIDLSDDLMMFVSNGRLDYVLNTSTGGRLHLHD